MVSLHGESPPGASSGGGELFWELRIAWETGRAPHCPTAVVSRETPDFQCLLRESDAGTAPCESRLSAVLASGDLIGDFHEGVHGGSKVAGNTTESTISISAPDRRGLIERLCVSLNDVLASGGGAEFGGTLLPWQATTAAFADLPREIVATVYGAVDDEDARLGVLELGGYLETDQGSRAWGTVALRDGEPGADTWVDVDSIGVEESETGLRLELTVRSSALDQGGGDV